MSQQLTLDKFFLKTANTKNQGPEENMLHVKPKKRNLSLTRVSTSPSKYIKSSESGSVAAIVDLCSDSNDDDSFELNLKCKEKNLCTNPIKIELTPELKNAIKQELLTQTKSPDNEDTSDATIEYSLTPELQNTIAQGTVSNESRFGHDTNNTDNTCDVKPSTSINNIKTTTPKRKENVSLQSLVTPHNRDATDRSSVSPQTPQTSKSTGSPVVVCVGSSSRNPNQLTYYSPNKKRKVMQKRANACRNLNTELSSLQNNDESITALNEAFVAACSEMDDKTIFMLDVIYRYLKDPSLHHLLDSTSHNLLSKCLEVQKPGMTIVCRLYWKKEGWYKKEELQKIALDNVKKTLSDDVKKYLSDNVDKYLSDDVMKDLIDASLIVEGDDKTMTFGDYVNILKKEEILQICKELNIKTSKQKQEAVEELFKFSKRTSNISNYFTGKGSNNLLRLLAIMSEKSGPCYKLSEGARSTFHKLYVMMYLGINYDLIREKRLELILIYDKVGQETYPVDKGMELDSASIIFNSRDEFERYIAAHNIYEDYIQRTDVEEKCSIIEQVYQLYKSIGEDQLTRYASLPTWLSRYTPVDIYIKLLELGIKELKKKSDQQNTYNSLALSILDELIGQGIFRQHRKAMWYDEKALILESNGLLDQAANILLEGFNSEMSEEEKDILRPRALKIAKKSTGRASGRFQANALDPEIREVLIQHATSDKIHENNIGGEHIHKPPMDRDKARGKLKFETKTAEGRLVQDAEHYCIAYYICNKDFTNGEHWEGRIITTIFYLLFWDIIYSKPAGVRGVFLSYYQQFPLDLYTDCFYTNRKTDIDNRLTFIENAHVNKLLNNMQDVWDQRPEKEQSGLNKDIGWGNISSVVRCLGARVVSAICRRLARNYRYSHSGFPDLTLWNRHTNRIKFVEVKTDSDKPSMKQIQWMNFLKEIKVETEFCYVGVNTTRQRCRNANKNSTPKTQKSGKSKARKSCKSETSEMNQTSQSTESANNRISTESAATVRLSTDSSTSNRISIESSSNRIKSEVDSDDDFQMSSKVKVEKN